MEENTTKNPQPTSPDDHHQIAHLVLCPSQPFSCFSNNSSPLPLVAPLLLLLLVAPSMLSQWVAPLTPLPQVVPLMPSSWVSHLTLSPQVAPLPLLPWDKTCCHQCCHHKPRFLTKMTKTNKIIVIIEFNIKLDK